MSMGGTGLGKTIRGRRRSSSSGSALGSAAVTLLLSRTSDKSSICQPVCLHPSNLPVMPDRAAFTTAQHQPILISSSLSPMLTWVQAGSVEVLGVGYASTADAVRS